MSEDAQNGGGDDETAKRSIGEMADGLEDGDMELFPLGSIEGDPGVTLKTLIKGGHKVESTISMGTAEVPSPKGGLLDPAKEGMVLVTFEVSGYTPVPIREGNRQEGKKITGWKIRQNLRPIYVERVDGAEGEIEANFALLLDGDEQRAGALLDKLKERLAAKLAEGSSPKRETAAA